MIPDCQVRDGVRLDHLSWCGKYLADKRPDVIVQIGDFADMPSLSDYDRGKKSYEGRRYRKDIEAAKRGMELLLSPILRARGGYKPRLVLTLGNHEDRINRAVERQAELEDVISVKDLGYKEAGWQVSPFLKPVKIGGVMFSHYFPSGKMGRPCTTPSKMLNLFHMSCVAGHAQGLDMFGPKYKADGDRLTCIIAGSFYQHSEGYMDHISNEHWRGIIMLHEVSNGNFDPMPVSLNFLKKRFRR